MGAQEWLLIVLVLILLVSALFVRKTTGVERFAGTSDVLTEDAKRLIASACVVVPKDGGPPYTFDDIFERNPLDPGGTTCMIKGTGFGLLSDPSTCLPAPDVSGTVGGDGSSGDAFAPRTFSWTNPLTDGTLDALGAKFDQQQWSPAVLSSGEPVCVVDFADVATSESMSRIDDALKQEAASLASGSYYSSAVIAGLREEIVTNTSTTASKSPQTQQQQQQQQQKQQQKQQSDLVLQRLRAASVAQCPAGQPCGTTGTILQNVPGTGKGIARNVCVSSGGGAGDAATAASCMPPELATPQLWTLTSTSQLVLSSSVDLPVPTCLAVSPSTSPTSPDVVVDVPCDPTDDKQRWTVPKKSRDERHPRTGEITNASLSPASPSCLDASDGNGGLALRPCISSLAAQKWTFTPAPSISAQQQQQQNQMVTGRLATPSGRCVGAERDPSPWGTDPATGQPYLYRLVEVACASSSSSAADQMFSVNDNGTLESVAFPGECVAFDAKSWPVGGNVLLASCDRSATPADAQSFHVPKKVTVASPKLFTRDGSVGRQACLSLPPEAAHPSASPVPAMGTTCDSVGFDTLRFQNSVTHPSPPTPIAVP